MHGPRETQREVSLLSEEDSFPLGPRVILFRRVGSARTADLAASALTTEEGRPPGIPSA